MPPQPKPFPKVPQNPQLKIKNPEFSLGLLSRIRRMDKKDLAAIGAGLSLLITLPVAENYISRSTDEGFLTPGFSSRDTEMFGDGGGKKGAYEPGAGGLGAPGSVPGEAGEEYVTPLDARDPASLVMGLGGPRQKPAGEEEDLKDALANALQQGTRQANQSAGLPKPSKTLASHLRLGGGGGGGGGTTAAMNFKGTNIKSAAGDVPSAPGARRLAYSGARGMPGYGGVAPRSLNAGTGEALERLRSEADKAAMFNRNAGAVKSLDQAGKDALDLGAEAGGGSSGAGSGHDKEGGKFKGGSPNLGSKTLGENLDALRKRKQLEREEKLKDHYLMESLTGKEILGLGPAGTKILSETILGAIAGEKGIAGGIMGWGAKATQASLIGTSSIACYKYKKKLPGDKEEEGCCPTSDCLVTKDQQVVGKDDKGKEDWSDQRGEYAGPGEIPGKGGVLPGTWNLVKKAGGAGKDLMVGAGKAVVGALKPDETVKTPSGKSYLIYQNAGGTMDCCEEGIVCGLDLSNNLRVVDSTNNKPLGNLIKRSVEKCGS